MTRSAIRTEFGMRDLKWSETEKAIARRAFDRALRQELQAVINKTRVMVEKIEEPADLWKLESYLTESRREIDRRFDYRYSVLPLVFADLIRKGRLRREDLQGLREDKLEYISR